MDGLPAPIRALQSLGLPFRLHEHPPAWNFDELHLTGLDVDASFTGLDVLYCGGGRPELSIELTPDALLQAMPGAILADLCGQSRPSGIQAYALT